MAFSDPTYGQPFDPNPSPDPGFPDFFPPFWDPGVPPYYYREPRDPRPDRNPPPDTPPATKPPVANPMNGAGPNFPVWAGVTSLFAPMLNTQGTGGSGPVPAPGGAAPRFPGNPRAQVYAAGITALIKIGTLLWAKYGPQILASIRSGAAFKAGMDSWDAVVARARKLSPADAYKLLSDWVLTVEERFQGPLPADVGPASTVGVGDVPTIKIDRPFLKIPYIRYPRGAGAGPTAVLPPSPAVLEEIVVTQKRVPVPSPSPHPSLFDQFFDAAAPYLQQYSKSLLNRALAGQQPGINIFAGQPPGGPAVGRPPAVALPALAPSLGSTPFQFLSGFQTTARAAQSQAQPQPAHAMTGAATTTCVCTGNRAPKRNKRECGQGYFREKPGNLTEFTYWSHRLCP